MLDNLEKILMPLAEKVGNNKYLNAIRDSFLMIIPLFVVSSLFLLMANFPIPGWIDFWVGLFGENWIRFFSKPVDAIYSILSILIVLGVGYSFSEQMKVRPIYGAILSLINFSILLPFEVSGKVGQSGSISLQWVGVSGIFIAIVVAIITIHIYSWVENQGLTIQIPEGVPQQVERSFTSLIPTSLSLFTFFTLNILFEFTQYGNAFNFMYKTLQLPLLSLGNTLGAMIVAYIFLHVFWFFGINGSSIIGAVYNPMLQTLSAENILAYRTGNELPNIITQQFQDLFATFGGAGSTLSLIIAMIIFCRSRRMTELAKLSILPGVFGINEPVIFGLPIVLSPVLFIPFVMVPIVNIVITYLFMSMELVPYTSGIALPWTVPVIVSGFLSTGWRGALLQGLLLMIGVFLYYPFIQKMDKKYIAEEQQIIDDGEYVVSLERLATTSEAKLNVVMIFDQVQSGLGTDDDSNVPVTILNGAIGAGITIDKHLNKDESKVLATLGVGTQTYLDNPLEVRKELSEIINKLKADIVICGPAFDSKDFAKMSAEVAINLNAVTEAHVIAAMSKENIEIINTYKNDIMIVKTPKKGEVGLQESLIHLTEVAIELFDNDGELIENKSFQY